MGQPNETPSFKDPPTRKGKSSTGFARVWERWWWLLILVVVVITTIVPQIPGWMGMRGPLYESVALVEVESMKVSHTPELESNTVAPGTMPGDMSRLNDQFEIIKAEERERRKRKWSNVGGR